MIVWEVIEPQSPKTVNVRKNCRLTTITRRGYF
jgi:hypothetical protein